MVRMEVEVNAEVWLAEYGTDSDSDVEDYLLNHLTQSTAATSGALAITGFAVES